MIFELRRPIVIDTETYYDDKCSIKAAKDGSWVGGNWHYTHHREFYCYMVSWVDLETGESGVTTVPRSYKMHVNNEPLTHLYGRTIVAHNAGFDIAVLKWLDPAFQPFNTFDTADMASYLQCARSLKDAALNLLGVTMDKGMRDGMKGKHFHDLSFPDQDLMKAYALKDAKVTAELFKKHHKDFPELEQWMSNFTRIQNEEGVHIDQNYLQEQIDRVSHTMACAWRIIPWSEYAKPLSPKYLAYYCRDVGIEPPASLAEDSEECQAWETKYGPTYPVVAAMRDFRKANTYYKKLLLIQALLRPDGTIPLSTKYAAAPHTLRFSATQFNYQSLPKPDAVDASGNRTVYSYADLRGCLVPAPGNLFIGSDLAGIEARCLPWLAGDTVYLGAVQALDRAAEASGVSGGGDIYEPAARRMFGYSDPRPLKKTDKYLREAAKACVLQLGYQSGKGKFLWYVENNVPPAAFDRVRGVNQETGQPETNEDIAARLVVAYRSLNPKVTGLWYSLDNEMRISCRAQVPFTVQQPNGRKVYYWDLGLRTVEKPDGTSRQEVVGLNCRGDTHTKLYGGKITENICQEMARHVLVQSIYNLTQAGYKIRMSIHDENVVEVPATRATPETCRNIERIMSITPAWAPGLPLAASTGIMERYAKD